MAHRWGQIAVALLAGLGLAYGLVFTGAELLTAALAGLVAYIVIRWLVTWAYRIYHWYTTNGKRTRTCPGCGQYIYRQSGDWVMKCHRCGWTRGLPGVRVVLYSVPAIQLKRTILGPYLVIAVIATALLVTGLVGPATIPAGDFFDRDIDEDEVEQLILEGVNEERAEHGLSSLSHHRGVVPPAQAHANYMAEQGVVEHSGPDGETIAQRYHCSPAGENAAQTYVFERVQTENGTDRFTDEAELAAGLVQQWMNSPPHREAKLDLRWSGGAAAINVTGDKVYAVFAFCG